MHIYIMYLNIWWLIFTTYNNINAGHLQDSILFIKYFGWFDDE